MRTIHDRDELQLKINVKITNAEFTLNTLILTLNILVKDILNQKWQVIRDWFKQYKIYTTDRFNHGKKAKNAHMCKM